MREELRRKREKLRIRILRSLQDGKENPPARRSHRDELGALITAHNSERFDLLAPAHFGLSAQPIYVARVPALHSRAGGEKRGQSSLFALFRFSCANKLDFRNRATFYHPSHNPFLMRLPSSLATPPFPFGNQKVQKTRTDPKFPIGSSSPTSRRVRWPRKSSASV